MNKAIFITFVALLILASCATQPNIPPWQSGDPKETISNLVAVVNNSGWDMKQSLPELKYAQENLFFNAINTTDLLSAERHKFKVLVISCPSSSFPGDNFMLAYLLDDKGGIVDWKSQWLYNRKGRLQTKILDVNGDGVAELCFLCEPFRHPEQLLSAFCVSNGRFDPVIAENKNIFEVEFEETTLDDRIVIQPQQKGLYSWETDKLYEIPVKVINRSARPVDLRGRSVWLSGDFYGLGVYGGFKSETLEPGGAVETTLTVMFAKGFCPARKFGFQLTPRLETLK